MDLRNYYRRQSVRNRSYHEMKNRQTQNIAQWFTYSEPTPHSSMTVSVLPKGLRDIVQRRITEQKLIRLFRTDENGSNRNMGLMSNYK